MRKPTIWFIHGAHATPTSFMWLKNNIPAHRHVDLSYDLDRSVGTIIDNFHQSLSKETKPVQIIGHSLGGIIGLALAQRNPKIVQKLVTMGTPFGGSAIATILRWFLPSHLLNDIHPRSALLHDIQSTPAPCPILSLVTHAGASPMIRGENDGVVSVASQMALEGPTYVPINVNHFEVLLAPEAASHIRSFLFR